MERMKSNERTKPTCPEVAARLEACADRERCCGIGTMTALGIRVVGLRRRTVEK
ncbi:MAG: hypothetical protein K2H69_02505 [Alistipes sp.]|nr:hypothetical protein [Alistipes sp.]